MEIIPNVYQLDCTPASHVYAVRSEDGVTLIDSSFPGLGTKILAELESSGIAPKQIRRILLTHRDTDHIGGVADIQAASGCEVYIGAADLAVALGKKRAPGLKGLMSLVMHAKCPADTKPMPSGQINGFTIYATPGHTPGHCCFQWQTVLFLGDLVFSTRDRLRYAPAVYIEDKARNTASIGRISLDGVEWLCPAHGPPIRLTDSVIKQAAELGF